MTLTPHLKHVILAVLAGSLILLISWKVIAHLDGIAHDQAILAKVQVDADLQKAKLQAGQTKAADQSLQMQLTALANSNAAKDAKISSLQNQLSDRRKQDDTLNPTDLASRWSTLIGVPATEIKPSANGIETTSVAAHVTVKALEEIPIIKQEEQALKDNSIEKDKTIRSQQNLITAVKEELSTCKKTVTDQQNKCDLEKKDIKDQARKHGIWAAIGGLISGFVLGKRF